MTDPRPRPTEVSDWLDRPLATAPRPRHELACFDRRPQGDSITRSDARAVCTCDWEGPWRTKDSVALMDFDDHVAQETGPGSN